MTVKVGISADPSGGVSAFNQISAAIRKAGQEGRKLSELDFSHPELKPLEEDIKRIQTNFEELQKAGRGATAAAVRKGGYDDVISWNAGHGRQFPDTKQRRNHFDTVSNYTTQGTRWSGSGNGNDDGGDKGGGGGSFFGGLSSMGMGKILGIGMAIAGIGKITSMVGQGVTSATDEAIQVDTFKRMIADTSTEFDDLRQSIRDAGDGLQLTNAETIKLAQSFAKASGYSNSKRINEEISTSGGFARAFGLDPNRVTQSFGKARWLQAGGGKDAGPKEMAVMFADAIAAGGMWSKADEVMNSIIGWVQQVERVTIDAPNARAYAELSSSMNDSGRPGLRGQAGAALISQIDQSIRGGGGAGDAGRNFLWRAINGDGKLSPYQMKFMLEKGGMFGTRSDVFDGDNGIEGDKSNYRLVQDQLRSQYDNPYQRADAMSRLFNISMPSAMAMDELKGVESDSLAKMLNKFDMNGENLTPTSIQDLAKLSKIKNGDLGLARTDILKRDGLTDAQRTELEKAGAGDELRKVMAQIYMKLGRETNSGTKIASATTSMANALTNVGSNLLAPIYTIKDVVSTIGNIIAAPSNAGRAFLRGASGLVYDAEDGAKAMMGYKKPISNAANQMDYVNGVPEFKVKVESAPLIIRHIDGQGRTIKIEEMPPPTVTPVAP